MAEFLTPGVYVQEIERGVRPIEGVPTSTAAFLGETERGPVWPTLVTSYPEYFRWFGGVFQAGRYMPHAVSGFFENGGKRLYVARIVGAGAVTASVDVGDFTLAASGPGAWGKNVWFRIIDGSTKDKDGNSGFCLRLAYWSTRPPQPYDPFELANRTQSPRPQYAEAYDDLSTDPASPDYFGKRLVDSGTNLPSSVLAALTARTAAPGKPPTNGPASGAFIEGGVEGADAPGPLTAADYLGEPLPGDDPTGLKALELDAFKDVALVYAPFPSADPVAVNAAVYSHCERLAFRFAVIDAAKDDVPSRLDPRQDNKWDTSYAAFYTPWIYVTDPQTGAREVVPPGGHVLGVYARTDGDRGVFKAPANEILRGALDVYRDIDDGTQGELNPRGVDVIRSFPSRGIRIWGARTLSSNTLWKYVSVRRLFIFLEHSIYDGTQWVVFEPNDERLWDRVKDTVRLFLLTQWRAGALLGRTEEEAFFITCDQRTMTPDDILNGRLLCDIGIAPVRPAEFVVFQVFQQTAEAQR